MDFQLLITAPDTSHGVGHSTNRSNGVPNMPASTTTILALRVSLRRRAQDSAQFAADNDRTQGTCSYYPTDTGGCRAPRSCYDCLNAALEKEPDGCMINQVGRCVSVAGNYDVSLDFRVVSATPVGGEGGSDASNRSSSSANDNDATQPPAAEQTLQLQFPAVNTTYCEDDDTLLNDDQLAGAGFMYGTGGCVFVQACGVPSWAYVVGGSDCSGLIAADYNGPSADDHKGGKVDNPQGYLAFWCVAIAIILTLVATLTMVITIHHHHSKRRLDNLQRRRTIVVGEPIASAPRTIIPNASKSGVRLLNLFGWEAMRADLIEKERQDMHDRMCAQAYPASENSLPGSSPSTNYLQLVGVEPSAPVMSPIVSSAPRLTDC
ncbi:hypothetical protein PHYPSEUDO_002056 [Phytophthora pseudosyringae]|uniref:Uncharacterized protein n=1 Tax=Phytophthora pseudosyringae TaxID=221518 RepID=A0A8T1VZC5_9STRA|nr:hypothetical protein PHYPSEUDO_002056 [Phytophthora pseudosyringae]